MTTFSTAEDGYDRGEVDTQLAHLRDQLAQAVGQLDSAAEALRSSGVVERAAGAVDADAVAERDALAVQLQQAVAERDAVRAELARLLAPPTATASAPPPAAPAATVLRRLPRPSETAPLLRRRPADRDELALAPLPPRPDPAPRPAGSPRGPLLVTGVAVALAGVLGFASLGGTGAPATRPLSGTTGPQAATAESAPPAVPSAGPAAAAARPVVAAPASVPPGWTPYRAPDGSYALALPPGWRSSRPAAFVSASGLTTLTVRSGSLAAEPSVETISAQEQALRARQPGYERVAARVVPFRGQTAGLWEYRLGAGAGRQQASELGVLVDGTGWTVLVQSRASSWEFAAPLRDGIVASFLPRGLTAPR